MKTQPATGETYPKSDLFNKAPIALTKLSLNISPDDRVKIVVTVSDGQSLHLSQQWPPSSEKS
nr:hypothetical protein [Escherichia coli]